MKKRFSPILLLAIVLALGWTRAFVSAQPFPNAWETYDQFDGVKGSWVFDVVQRDDAALWFATDEGVLRFNGATFIQEEGLPAGSVRDLLITNSDELWAGTHAGVYRRKDGTWSEVGSGEILSNLPALALAQDEQGLIIAGTESGLYTWNPDTDAWQKMDTAPELPVHHLAIDAHEDIWLASGSDLFRQHNSIWESVKLLVNDEPVSAQIAALQPSSAGGIWIGTDGAGLGYFQDSQLQWYDLASGLPGNQILALAEAHDGALWVGTNGDGLARLQDDVWRQYTITDGLAADYVTSVFEDADNILWLGTVAGITRYDNQTWRQWSGEEEAPAGLVSALARDNDGRLYAAAYGDGLYRFGGQQWQRLDTPGDETDLDAAFIETLFFDDKGALWAGTNGAGVMRISDSEETNWAEADGLASDVIMAIAQTPDGVMWFGSFEDGLSRWDGEAWQTITRADGLVDDHVRSLLVDGQGQLWVGTRNGVSKYDGLTWENIAPDEGLAASEVTAMAEDREGGIWFTTWGGGVSHYLDGEWTSFTTSDGLLAPGVEAVYADPDSDVVWFGAVSGLSVYDGRTWQNFRAANGSEIGRIYALAPGPEGGVFIGSENGVAQYTPEQTAPQVQVLTVNGMEPQGDVVRISPQEQVRITLDGADLLTPKDELFFIHRLSGVESDWVSSRSHTLTYPALAEGTYQFKVMARDASMNYSDPVIVTLDVTTSPSTVILPWLGPTRSEYALLGVALATLISILIVYAIWSTATRLAMRRQAVERRFNPYVAGPPIRETSMFYGREALLAEINTALYQNSILLHGERRIGKTSLLYQLQEHLATRRDPAFWFIPIYVDLEGAPEPEFFHRLMEGVLETVKTNIRNMPGLETLHYYAADADDAYSDRDFRRDLRDIIEYLSELSRRQPRLVFLLDEADILNTYDTLTQQQLRRILQDAFAHNVGAVVAGVNISKAWDRVESPWYNMFVEIEMSAFDQHEAEHLMREPVARFYEWDEDAIQYIWAQSQGRPHRIQQISLEAVNLMLDDGRRRITLADARQAYEQVLAAES